MTCTERRSLGIETRTDIASKGLTISRLVVREVFFRKSASERNCTSTEKFVFTECAEIIDPSISKVRCSLSCKGFSDPWWHLTYRRIGLLDNQYGVTDSTLTNWLLLNEKTHDH